MRRCFIAGRYGALGDEFQGGSHCSLLPALVLKQRLRYFSLTMKEISSAHRLIRA